MRTYRFGNVKIRFSKRFMTKTHPFWFYRTYKHSMTLQCGPVEFFYYDKKEI